MCVRTRVLVVGVLSGVWICLWLSLFFSLFVCVSVVVVVTEWEGCGVDCGWGTQMESDSDSEGELSQISPGCVCARPRML